MGVLMKFDHYMPVPIHFGWGRLSELGEVAASLGRRALVVIGRGSVRRSGALDRALDSLKGAGVEAVVFEGVPPNPTSMVVYEGARLARSERCDLVVGLGGGSSVDCAKGVAVAAVGDRPVWDYVTGELPKKALPVVAVPTTAGTGTEANPYAVLTNPDIKEKRALNRPPFTYPRASIVDPELTLSLPPRQTAITGMDVLFHALEAFVGNRSQPVVAAMAEQAIRGVARFLRRAVRDGADREAREGMSWACTAAGMAINGGGTTALHGMEHPVSTHLDVSHAEGLCALSGPYLRYLVDVVPRKMARVAEWLGEEVSGLPEGKAARRTVEAMEELEEDLGLDISLRDLGASEDMLEHLTDDTLRVMGHNVANTPGRPDRERILRFFREALG